MLALHDWRTGDISSMPRHCQTQQINLVLETSDQHLQVAIMLQSTFKSTRATNHILVLIYCLEVLCMEELRVTWLNSGCCTTINYESVVVEILHCFLSPSQWL